MAVNYVAHASSADKLVRELTDKGHQAAAFRADVADRTQTADLVARVVAEFGGLDVLASNAGVEGFGAVESITDGLSAQRCRHPGAALERPTVLPGPQPCRADQTSALKPVSIVNSSEITTKGGVSG